MKNPIVTFCEIVENLPEPGRSLFVNVSCIALGMGQDCTEEFGDTMRLPPPFQQATVNDLRDRLSRLIDIVGIQDRMLIPAIAYFALHDLKLQANEVVKDIKINADLEGLDKLSGWRKMPIDNRPMKLTDEQIDDMRQRVTNAASNRGIERESAEFALKEMKEKFEGTFTKEYWLEWAKYSARRRGAQGQ